MVSNDTMSAVSKSNKCKTCQQKITNPLTNERHIVNSYFCTHVSRLLNFDTNGVVSFDIKYFFLEHEVSTFIYIYIYIYIEVDYNIWIRSTQMLHQLLRDPLSESVYHICLFRFFMSKSLKLIQQLQIFFS